MVKDAVLNESDYRGLADMIYRTSGINLGQSKQQMLATRLRKRLAALGLNSFADYRAFLASQRGKDEIPFMLDVVSTNKTSFFRENAHFQFLKAEVFPQIHMKPELRFWSAACSSGEEPVSLAITYLAWLENRKPARLKILGTDISMKMLAQAERGIYEDIGSSVPEPLLRRFFLESQRNGAPVYRTCDAVQKLIFYRYLNLMTAFPFAGRFDVVLCRNVMIYFDKETQAELVQRILTTMNPGGYLFIGHSESLNGLNIQGIEFVRPAVFRKKMGQTHKRRERSIGER